MSFSLTTPIIVSTNVLSSQLGAESIILDHEKGEYFGLDNVGSFVWEKIQAGETTLSELKTAVMEEFEIDEATCESDLQALLAQFAAEKLILV
jgi:hypothetical protein